MSRGWWLALQVVRRLWFRAALYAVVSIAIAVAGILVGPYIPDRWSDMVGAKAVDGILSIIASSMLTVTTFSLSTLVAATSVAATSGTPRSISLLLQDRIAQSALSTFLGAFLFSLVGLIALNTGLYGGGGRLVLFAATLVVIVLIVTMLLRWIDHLAGLGQVGETIRRVGDVSRDVLDNLARQPCMGARRLEALPATVLPLYPTQTGFLCHLDMPELSIIAKRLDARLHVVRRPGDLCSPAAPLLYLEGPQGFGEEDGGNIRQLRRAFTLDGKRSFDQDPRFCLSVLSEIASRALSPGINDPGTALDVVAEAARLLGDYRRKASDAAAGCEEPEHPLIYLRPLPAAQLIESAFLPITRDGAAMLEVGIGLQQALATLTAGPKDELSEAASAMARTALERGIATLTFQDDRERLRQANADPADNAAF